MHPGSARASHCPHALVRASVAAAAVLLGGCLPLAWVTPPAEVDLGQGARATLRAPSPDPASPSAPAADGSGFRLRATMHPLGAVRDQMDRRYDLGVGYLLDPPLAVGAVHGTYLEGTWIPLRARLFGSGVLRLRLRGQARVLFASDVASAGFGVSAGAEAEVAGFVDGGFADGSSSGNAMGAVAGGGVGELGVGLYAEVALAELGPYAWMDVSGGIALRIPLSGGVGVVCCFVPN